MKESEKYVSIFNPFACGLDDGGFVIKQNDSIQTHIAVVPCSIGAKSTPKWKQQASDKAELLALNPELLDFLECALSVINNAKNYKTLPAGVRDKLTRLDMRAHQITRKINK